MNPIPVSAPAAAPPPAAVLSRPVPSSTGSRGANRAVGTERADVARSLGEDAHDEAFADILADVQRDVQAGNTRPVADDEVDVGQVVRVDVPAESSPAIVDATPWLLVALAQRAMTRAADSASTDGTDHTGQTSDASPAVTGGAADTAWWPPAFSSHAGEQTGVVPHGSLEGEAGAVELASPGVDPKVSAAVALGEQVDGEALTEAWPAGETPAGDAPPTIDAFAERLKAASSGSQDSRVSLPVSSRPDAAAPEIAAGLSPRSDVPADVTAVADAGSTEPSPHVEIPAVAAAREVAQVSVVTESVPEAAQATPQVVAPATAPAASSPDVVATERTTATPAVIPPDVAEQVTTHIVSSLRMQWKDGVGEARMILRPEALGAVTVSLRVEQGAVTAVVKAESAQVQDWVLQHQQALRAQLDAAGLRLDELSVSPDDRGQSSGRDEQQAPRRRRHAAEESDERAFAQFL